MVNPPSTPTPRNGRASRCADHTSVISTISTPIRRQPTTLVTKVPHGNPQVTPATSTVRPNASGMRQPASAGTYAISADAPAAELMAMVSTKSTINAPIGTNAHASPNASPAAAAAPPPAGYRATNW